MARGVECLVGESIWREARIETIQRDDATPSHPANIFEWVWVECRADFKMDHVMHVCLKVSSHWHTFSDTLLFWNQQPFCSLSVFVCQFRASSTFQNTLLTILSDWCAKVIPKKHKPLTQAGSFENTLDSSRKTTSSYTFKMQSCMNHNMYNMY